MICVLCAELIGMGMEKINMQVLTQTLGKFDLHFGSIHYKMV